MKDTATQHNRTYVYMWQNERYSNII